MSGLQSLSKNAIKDEVDFANLPEQMGGSAPPPQPGPYRFALSPLPDANFEAKAHETGDRVVVKFDETAPLVIVQSVGGVRDGEPFRTTISNIPRKRGKGDNAPQASDWDYLNQALGETTRPTSAYDYAVKLQARAAKREQFAADIEWSWSCNPNKPARFVAEDGSLQEVINDATGTPHQGCGKRYYQKDVPKVAVEGGAVEFPLYHDCECGARVRAFGNLTRFRK